jgi:hypothetical protein
VFRPCWYFPADYLMTRLTKYIPFTNRIQPASFVKTITLPLNLFDSIGAIYQAVPV